MSLVEDFRDKAESDVQAAQRHAAEDRDLLQSEISGVSTGKSRKFLVSSEYTDTDGSDTGKGKKDRLSALEIMLLTDPLYEEHYQRTWDALNDAEAETEIALAEAITALEEANAALDDTLDRAAKLPDGTRVFKDADGNVWDEHGNPIDPETAASVVWKSDSPSYEEYRAAKERAEAAKKHVDDWLDYQTNVLGSARGRLSDPDNPPSREDLDRIMREIEERRPETISRKSSFTEEADISADKPAFRTTEPPM